MTHSLHGWLHDERSRPPSLALTCVPPVGLEPTALGLGIARADRSSTATCSFSGAAVGVTGSTDRGWHQFAPRMAPRAGAGRESIAQDQMPSNLRPSCSAKSLKSLMFKVARGRS